MDMWSGPETSEILRNSKRIGLFDSGVGGLSVLKELQGYAASTGRDIEFVYVGDTARCPYGNRTAEEIRLFVEEIVLWLNQQKVDAVIMACNTSAALALPYAKLASSVPVIDLIGPTANYISSVATRVGVMATAPTVRSKAFSRAITCLNPQAEVTEIGCPDLVPIIESGNIDAPGTEQVLLKYVDAMKAARVEAIILGCTHFPFLRKHIQKLAGEDIRIIDPAESLTAESIGVLKKFINEISNGLEAEELSGNALLAPDMSFNTRFHVTGAIEQFRLAAGICLGQPITPVHALSLNELASVHAVGPTARVGTTVGSVVTVGAVGTVGNVDQLDHIEEPFVASQVGHQTSQVAAS
jgi:glutamate racemase